MQTPRHKFRPAVQEDIPAVAQLARTLFADANHTAVVAPHAKKYPEQFYQWTLNRYRMRFNNSAVSMTVVEDETGEIVACSTWTPVGDSSARSILPVRNLWNSIEYWLLDWELWYMKYFILECIDWKAYQSYVSESTRIFQGIPKRLHLDVLIVRQDCQGKGIGKALLRRGFDIARDAGIPVTLESTELGKPLYDKEGFKVIGYLDIDGSDLKIPAMEWRIEK